MSHDQKKTGARHLPVLTDAWQATNGLGLHKAQGYRTCTGSLRNLPGLALRSGSVSNAIGQRLRDSRQQCRIGPGSRFQR